MISTKKYDVLILNLGRNKLRKSLKLIKD